MTDGAEQSKPSASNTPSANRADDNSLPKRAFSEKEGPGVVGLELSRIKGCIRDLGIDRTIQREDRDLLRLYYTREREKLQLRLGVLGETEKVKVSYERNRRRSIACFSTSGSSPVFFPCSEFWLCCSPASGFMACCHTKWHDAEERSASARR